MNPRLRRDLAIGVAVLALACGTLAVVAGRVDMGFSFGQDGDLLVITAVRADSPAEREGFRPGMVVVSVNDAPLIRLPQYVYPEEPEPTLETSPVPTTTPGSTPDQQTAVPPGSAAPSAAPSPGAEGSSGLATPSSAPPSAATPGTSAAPAATAVPEASPSASPLAPVVTPAPAAGGPADPNAETPGPTPYLDPPVPTVTGIDGYGLVQAIQGIGALEAVAAEALRAPGVEFSTTYIGGTYEEDLKTRTLALLAGALILLAGALFGGLLGTSLRPLAAPLAVATATPLLVLPMVATWFGPAVVLAGILVPLGMLPLADVLAGRIADPELRRNARTIAGGCLVGAVGLALVGPAVPASDNAARSVYYALVVAIPLIPGMATLVASRLGRVVASADAGPLQATELAVAGGTPVAAVATAVLWNPLLLPLSAWLVGIALAGRLTVRPLSHLLSRSLLQRDLVVAATEAERARVAADIHDDALQALTMLALRLDAAGDTDNAEAARGVAERLRAICGDLRLPLLDDLGVGPALDWLVGGVEGIAGGEVRLERSGETRPPRDVELAFFRVAQEALANAARHGKPPIVVRYHASEAGAVLTVDDAGPGIGPHDADAAEQAGRFGLLNMRQRAEQIGAILDVRPWPGGGTHVGLQWRAP